MSTRASERISTAKTGWVVALLMVGWVLFLILPFGRDEPAPVAPHPVDRPGEADLAAVGLHYNVDWIGLPQYFAVWSKSIQWTNDKVQFAYWNAGRESYSYFFEATRRDGSVRFRSITVMEMTLAPGLYAYETEEGEIIGEGADPDRTNSETHPFVFWSEEMVTIRGPEWVPTAASDVVARPQVKAEVDLKVQELEVPKPVLQSTTH
jgi:hypothetical protein